MPLHIVVDIKDHRLICKQYLLNLSLNLANLSHFAWQPISKTVCFKHFDYHFINTTFESSTLFLLELIVNMALRANSDNSSVQTSSLTHLVGLPVFWHDADENPTMEWDKWVSLFQVAAMAKYSISITELTRQVTEQSRRVRALTGDLDEDPASKKIVSVHHLSLGGAARKQFRDKIPHTTLWDLKAGEMLYLCTECFQKKRNRTLDRHRFFSRYQQPRESLYQYWHALNGLAAHCDLGEITTTLVLDMFILHMNNTKVQVKLCTEPKEP